MGTRPADNVCCVARGYFILAIVGATSPTMPLEVGDFITDWGPPRMRVDIRYCPFCGQIIDSNQPRRVTAIQTPPGGPT